MIDNRFALTQPEKNGARVRVMTHGNFAEHVGWKRARLDVFTDSLAARDRPANTNSRALFAAG